MSALRRDPAAILAISDIQTHGFHTGVHHFGAAVSTDNPSRRLGWILRQGGWGAIYGLIRRSTLERCRWLSSVRGAPPPGLSPDYLVIELALIGHFALVPEPLLSCHTRPMDNTDELREKIGSPCSSPPKGSVLSWYLRDLWRVAKKHLPLRQRFSVELEFLASATTSGTLNDVLREWLRQAALEQSQKPVWRRNPGVFAERALLEVFKKMR